MIIIISLPKKEKTLHFIVIQSYRKKVQYIHSHIYSSVSFHSDKVVSARDQEGRVDHGPSEAISAGQQGLGGSALVPTYITPAFPNVYNIGFNPSYHPGHYTRNTALLAACHTALQCQQSPA